MKKLKKKYSKALTKIRKLQNLSRVDLLNI